MLALQCPIIMTSNHTSPSGLLGNLPARTISFVRPSTDEVKGSTNYVILQA